MADLRNMTLLRGITIPQIESTVRLTLFIRQRMIVLVSWTCSDGRIFNQCEVAGQ